MLLLERESQFEQLHLLLQEAEESGGRLVLLSADGGGGKSSLIKAFVNSVRDTARTAVVPCDGLDLPGPLGGLLDIAAALDPAIGSAVIENRPRDQIFRSILEALLSLDHPNVIVGEDAHLSDEATIDLIRFLGRRISATRTLLIVTFRDDSIGSNQPFRRLLGDLATESSVVRMTLPPLTEAAVRTLTTATGINPVELHERTGGNPFCVTEVIGSGSLRIPATIRDAVLGRAARVSPQARSVIDIAAVVGPTLEVDIEVVSTVAGAPVVREIEESLDAGVLQATESGVAFRHAIPREVFIEAISPPRRRDLNRRVLRVMEEQPRYAGDLARLAHHAEEGNDPEAVIRYAPAAGRLAAQYGAHREAAAQFARALRFAHELPVEVEAELREANAYECYLTGLITNAVAEQALAVSLWRSQGAELKSGNALRLLSRYHWFAGHDADAESLAFEALKTLEVLTAGAELAMAYSSLSQIRMLAHDAPAAIEWGQRAIGLAIELGDKPTLSHAMTNVGTAMFFSSDSGQEMIAEAAEIALACDLPDDVSRAYANLAYLSVEHCDLAEAEGHLKQGLAYTSQHDLIAMELYMHALQARWHLARGAWSEALKEAQSVVSHANATALAQIVALTVLGQVQARRGEPSQHALDGALELAEQTGALMRLGPVRFARAEAAWLAGSEDLAVFEAEQQLGSALKAGEQWIAGSLAVWPHRCGRTFSGGSAVALPYELEISGRNLEAAAVWHQLGMPLEEARVLEQEGEEGALRQALLIYDRLGARPDAARAGRALRGLGAKRIPRGPRPRTRENIAHLTGREIEVLQHLVEGRTNPEIASVLFLSPRTVGHHVSSILAKLEISSRTEVKDRAKALGLL